MRSLAERPAYDVEAMCLCLVVVSEVLEDDFFVLVSSAVELIRRRAVAAVAPGP